MQLYNEIQTLHKSSMCNGSLLRHTVHTTESIIGLYPVNITLSNWTVSRSQDTTQCCTTQFHRILLWSTTKFSLQPKHTIYINDSCDLSSHILRHNKTSAWAVALITPSVTAQFYWVVIYLICTYDTVAKILARAWKGNTILHSRFKLWQYCYHHTL